MEELRSGREAEAIGDTRWKGVCCFLFVSGSTHVVQLGICSDYLK